MDATDRLFTFADVKTMAGFRPTPEADEEWAEFIADLDARGGWLSEPVPRLTADDCKALRLAVIFGSPVKGDALLDGAVEKLQQIEQAGPSA